MGKAKAGAAAAAAATPGRVEASKKAPAVNTEKPAAPSTLVLTQQPQKLKTQKGRSQRSLKVLTAKVRERRSQGRPWRLLHLRKFATAHTLRTGRTRRKQLKKTENIVEESSQSETLSVDASKGTKREQEKQEVELAPKRRKILPDPLPLEKGQEGEKSRLEMGLELLGELAPPNLDWTYPLVDEQWRCFAGYLPNAIAKDKAKEMFNIIKDGTKWLQPSGRWGPLPLKTAWMVEAPCACTYRYGGAEVDPDPFPEWMFDIMKVCLPLCGLPKREQWPNSCNLNLYVDGGHSVGWHADNESLFQGTKQDIRIISLSLGQTREFALQARGCEMHKLNLNNGDLCTMEGLTQKHYRHRVPKEPNTKKLKSRINLTWRWVVQHGPTCCKKLV